MLSGTESTIIAELMKRHNIEVPMKTHGWINKQLVRVFFDDKYKWEQNPTGINYSFYKGHDSKTFNGYLKMLEKKILEKLKEDAV